MLINFVDATNDASHYTKPPSSIGNDMHVGVGRGVAGHWHMALLSAADDSTTARQIERKSNCQSWPVYIIPGFLDECFWTSVLTGASVMSSRLRMNSMTSLFSFFTGAISTLHRNVVPATAALQACYWDQNIVRPRPRPRPRTKKLLRNRDS